MGYQSIPDLFLDSEPNGSSVLPLEQDLDSSVTSAVTAACEETHVKMRFRVFGTPGAVSHLYARYAIRDRKRGLEDVVSTVRRGFYHRDDETSPTRLRENVLYMVVFDGSRAFDLPRRADSKRRKIFWNTGEYVFCNFKVPSNFSLGYRSDRLGGTA